MSAEPDAPAVEPSDEVYCVYGSVMHIVQYWELLLAMRWWQMLTPPVDRREAESKAAAKAIDRLNKAFTKVTASQARKDLEDELPPELLEAVGGLIDDRNRLAHRFLRERQAGPDFGPGTLALLGDYGARFDASIQSLGEVVTTTGSYEGAVRDHWPSLAETLAERLLTGEPVDFEAALREAHEEIRDA